MTSISNHGSKSSPGSNSKECFFCWKVFTRDNANFYYCSEKTLRTCKKYLDKKVLETSDKQNACDKVNQDILVCATCHESSEQLTTINDVLESVEKELREVVESFNSHILRFRDENDGEDEYIIGALSPIGSPVQTTTNSDDEDYFSPTGHSDGAEIPIEEPVKTNNSKKKRKSAVKRNLTNLAPDCPIRLESVNDKRSCELNISTNSKAKKMPKQSVNQNSPKIVENAFEDLFSFSDVDSDVDCRTFIEDVDIKYEIVEGNVFENENIARKPNSVQKFNKEIRVVLTRLSMKDINTQLALQNKKRKFIKRNAAVRAAANIRSNKKDSPIIDQELDPDFDPIDSVDDVEVKSEDLSEKQIHSKRRHSTKLSVKRSASVQRRRLPLEKRKKRHKNRLQNRDGFIYPCRECGEKFNYTYKLRLHMRKEHAEIVDETHSYSIKCKKCNKKFISSHALHQHEVRFHKNDKKASKVEIGEDSLQYCCTICEKVYQHQTGLRRHMLDHTRERIYQCEHCDKSFTQRFKWITHTAQHTEQFDYPCDRCEKKFKLKAYLLDHKKVHQRQDFLKDKNNDKGTHYQCNICNQSFKKEDASFFADHMTFHANENLYKCKMCDKSFPTKVLLNTHYDEEHGGLFPCDICGSKLKTFHGLSVHKKAVHGTDNLMCEICGASFKSSAHLRRHKETHGSRTLSCDQCDKKFVMRDKLNRHINMVHKKSLVVICDICGKRFAYRSQKYRDHLNLHTGNRPYKCTLCNEGFISKANLVSHVRRNHNVDKLECEECGKQFNSASNLKLHVRTHTGEKPFGCSVCNKRFDRKQNLTTHMRIHTGEKPYKCDGCGAQFSRKDNLNTHVRKCIHATER